MAYRIINTKVARVCCKVGKLVVKQNKLAASKLKFSQDIFMIDATTLITDKNNHTVPLSGVKVGSRVTIDFVRTENKKLLARGISVLG